MEDEMEFTLKSTLTEEQINLITDAEFEHTDRIWFCTPRGKHVEFVKAQQWIPCSERLPDDGGVFLVTTVGKSFGGNDVYTVEIMSLYHIDEHLEWNVDFTFERDWYNKKALAWMPLPKPYKADEEAE